MVAVVTGCLHLTAAKVARHRDGFTVVASKEISFDVYMNVCRRRLTKKKCF